MTSVAIVSNSEIDEAPITVMINYGAALCKIIQSVTGLRFCNDPKHVTS
jgi:hypothetical protein